MNLYKLHNDAKNVLDDYKNMIILAHVSIKDVDDYGDTEYKNVFGVVHRDDGPAYITLGGTEYWYKYGKKHRTDGPAVIYANGDVEYWLDDNRISNTRFTR